MVTWYICDHRAPAVLPRKSRDPESVYFAIVPAGLFVTLVTVLSWIPAMKTYTWVTAVVTVLWIVWAWYLVECRRRIFAVPNDRSRITFSGDMDIHRAVQKIQATYRTHRDLREAIEPVLIACYGFARKGQLEPISKREKAVNELVAEIRLAQFSEDNSDLDGLHDLIEVRKQMRREGLL